jgi:hypothetical protein
VWLAIGIALALVLALAVESKAWQEDAGIVGQVSDDSGAVLPGVTVVASSPPLQVPTLTARRE